MITEKDLQEAIAECQGQRNPNASTCLKLASYLTIQRELFPKEEKKEQKDHFADVGKMIVPRYSTAPEPEAKPVDAQTIDYISNTDFSQVIFGMDCGDVLSVMDELMSVLEATNPKLYNAVINKLEG